MIGAAQLDRALNPRTVAVVGDAQARNYRWLRCMSTFQGKVYSVQVDPKEIPGIEALGIPNYQSLTEIPDEIDYVLVAVPRNVAPVVLRDCITKQVGGVTMFTSGFAETDSAEGQELQEQITEMARDARLVLIGPNCMGLYNPALGVRFGENQASGFEGDVTFLSQSGGHGGDFATAAQASGVPIRKVVSFGNGVVLGIADFLEYFTEDDDTSYISMYLEGLREGPRFFQSLRRTTLKKPVVVWKGGLSDAGQRATASHTASLAGSAEVWDAMYRQTGAIPVTSVSEMIDVLRALRELPPFTGRGIGLTGGSGGQSVAMADTFSRSGLRVPTLTGDSYERLASWFRVIGASFGNPIDMGSNRTEIETIMEVLISDAHVDCLVVQLRPGSDDPDDQRRLDAQLDALVQAREHAQKPVAAIVYSSAPLDEGPAITAIDERLRAIGIPAFPTYERAAAALAKVSAYYRFREAALAATDGESA
ncbi:MAG: CoA-binding protein [Dehalococcoidia bacterium]|jgi:acyl-CoA synthetase (NDP forming)|nr:CoA-binding protein [Dehalococcoidia bacterium]